MPATLYWASLACPFSVTINLNGIMPAIRLKLGYKMNVLYWFINILWKHRCIKSKNLKVLQHITNVCGVGRFLKILRNFQSGSCQMLMSTYKVGGWGEKRTKTCLRNTWMVPNINVVQSCWNFAQLKKIQKYATM